MSDHEERNPRERLIERLALVAAGAGLGLGLARLVPIVPHLGSVLLVLAAAGVFFAWYVAVGEKKRD